MLYLTPRVGLEPTSENSKPAVDSALTEDKNPVLSTSLDNSLQKWPELEQIITAWPNLSEHIKALVKINSKDAKQF